tara:strand:+ start:473 stop:676 length:204 start_codon:yes stop_codon:yes gene_type:complete
MSKMRKLREEADLSQQELADQSGVSRSMISAIECGEKTPSVSMIKLLAAGLGVSSRRILNAVDPEFV